MRLSLIVLIGIVFFLYSCNGQHTKNVDIGVLMPLSTDVATLGVPAKNGISLAIKEYNNFKNNNDPNVDLLIEDTKAQPSFGVSAINKLITVNSVKVIIGPLTSTVTLSVTPIAEENKVVLLSPGSSAPKLTTAGDYIFRNELSDLNGGKAQALLAYDTLGFRKMAVVYINTDYGSGIYDVFRDEFEKKPGKILYSEAFKPGNTDFRTTINKIINSKIDAVFLVGIDEMINFIQQSYELGLNVPIFTTPIFENKKYLDKLGDLANGILYVYYGTFNPTSTDSLLTNFIDKYSKQFNSEPTYYSALGYDAANIILTALKMGDFNVENIKQNLYKIKNYRGITGNTSFDKNGDVNKPVILKTVRNNQFVSY
ncbi:MAG: penicillin-binding protein activator [Melioribacteraceae bacterium]|nr:penicillin-binding protein activator [Melioribacteraceae bacterium]MCF8353772.1 penicillin-binding protein activator [Melioribacteraceae bacterium]MCF8393608.1 penicillin-binding protein activator [Melioribacteraceae bacterium]MCF8419418.1 penicillin-binding protein activator [Melioribacteraceae bacterium]